MKWQLKNNPAGGISPVWLFDLIGALLLAAFFWHIGRMERAGKEPLLSTRMFQNRISNLGLVTQNIQWFVLLGLSFVVSVFLQTVRGNSAIQTGLILTPATVGILALALIVLGVFGVVGLVAALLLPKNVGTAQPEPNVSGSATT